MNSEDLYSAIEKNDIEFFINNIPSNFNINEKDINNVPFIVHVAKFGRFEMLQHMIKNNVDLNATFIERIWPFGTKMEIGAVYIAAGGGHLECLKLLVDAGAEYRYGFGESKQTPLQTACIQGKVHCVEYLLNKMKKREFDVKDEMEGWTAAHGAAGANEVECLKLLHEAGADLTIKSNTRPYETPLDVARRRGCSNAINYLKPLQAQESMAANIFSWFKPFTPNDSTTNTNSQTSTETFSINPK